MKKSSLAVLSLSVLSASVLLTSCGDEEVNIIINETHATESTEAFETDCTEFELLGGDYIASLDFTDCRVGLMECHGDRAEIVEYLSEEDTCDFVSCIKNAEISSEKKENLDLSYCIYKMLLNNGEEIYIGIFADSIAINGARYYCGEECIQTLRCYDKRLIEHEPTVEVSGSSVKNLDFTDCTIGVTDIWKYRIVGYMTDEMTEKFVECIKNADLSAEEIKNYEAAGKDRGFEIALSTGEKLYIEPGFESLLINGVGYSCDEEALNEINGFKIGVTYLGSAY